MIDRFKNFSRMEWLGVLFSLFAILIGVQMIRIQTSDSAKLISEKAEEYYTYVHKTIYPERGSIYDRWGHLLAGNKEVYELGVELQYVKNPATIAATAPW